jgi:hypothetical protein
MDKNGLERRAILTGVAAPAAARVLNPRKAQA